MRITGRILNQFRFALVVQDAVCITAVERIARADADCRKACAVEKGRTADAHNAVRDCNVCKACAVSKSIIADTCHAARNRYACKVRTVGKGTAADACHAVRNRDVSKARTVGKGIAADTCYAVPDCQIHKAAAVFKSIIADTCCAVGDRDAREAQAFAESMIADACHAVRNRHIGKFRADVERVIVDARYAMRDCYSHKASAVFKSIIAYAFYTVRDCHVCKALTAGEGSPADTRYTVIDDCRADLIPKRIPWRITDVVCHRAVAFDFQQSGILVPVPFYVITVRAAVADSFRRNGEGQSVRNAITAHGGCAEQQYETQSNAEKPFQSLFHRKHPFRDKANHTDSAVTAYRKKSVYLPRCRPFPAAAHRKASACAGGRRSARRCAPRSPAAPFR